MHERCGRCIHIATVKQRNIGTARKVRIAEIDCETHLLPLRACLVRRSHALHEDVAASEHAFGTHAINDHLGGRRSEIGYQRHTLQFLHRRADGLRRGDDNQLLNRFVHVGNDPFSPLTLQHVIVGRKEIVDKSQLYRQSNRQRGTASSLLISRRLIRTLVYLIDQNRAS